MIGLSIKRTDGITDQAYMEVVYQTIQRNMLYIRKVCKNDTAKVNDVSSRVLAHAIAHRDIELENSGKEIALDAYITSLCKHFYTDIMSEQAKGVEYDDSYQLARVFENYAFNYNIYDSEGYYVIIDTLVQHYLLYPNDVVNYCRCTLNALKIKTDVLDGLVTESCAASVFVPQDKKAWQSVRAVMRKYDAITVVNATITVAQRISTQMQRVKRRQNSVLEVKAVAVNYDVLQTGTQNVTVVVTKGGTGKQANKLYSIDPYTLQMFDETKQHTVNLDIVCWTPLKKNMKSIIAIDITVLLEYMYEQVCVPQVDTKFVKWLKGDNIKMLPSGTVLHNTTLEHYMLEVKAELLTTLLKTCAAELIGVTEDTIYCRPSKRPNYGTIMYRLFTGKGVNLPVRIVELTSDTSE